MRLFNVGTIGAALALLSACQPAAPVIEKATNNLIAIRYNAYGSTPTLTPEALDLAIDHCKKQGLFANYRGVTLPNPLLSATEIHTFVCERVKTDDNAVIVAQNQRYAASSSTAAGAVDAFVKGYNASSNRPTYTSCNTIGARSICTSY